MKQHKIIVTPSKMFPSYPKWLLSQEFFKTGVIRVHDPKGELHKIKDEFEKKGYIIEELNEKNKNELLNGPIMLESQSMEEH
jgi:hypothetical protein